jgi:hypothetical protein
MSCSHERSRWGRRGVRRQALGRCGRPIASRRCASSNGYRLTATAQRQLSPSAVRRCLLPPLRRAPPRPPAAARAAAARSSRLGRSPPCAAAAATARMARSHRARLRSTWPATPRSVRRALPCEMQHTSRASSATGQDAAAVAAISHGLDYARAGARRMCMRMRVPTSRAHVRADVLAGGCSLRSVASAKSLGACRWKTAAEWALA